MTKVETLEKAVAMLNGKINSLRGNGEYAGTTAGDVMLAIFELEKTRYEIRLMTEKEKAEEKSPSSEMLTG